MEAPTNFKSLYTCSIQPTGHLVYKTPTVRPAILPLTEEEKKIYPIENEIAIKFPESEYLRFVENWNNYMTIMEVAMRNSEVNEQYRNLLIMAYMLK